MLGQIKITEMKFLWNLIVFVVLTSSIHGQDDADILSIRNKVSKINTDSVYESIRLNNEDFSDISDTYTESTGLFKNDKLYKIYQKSVSIPQVTHVEYFFENEELIFIYFKVQFYSYDSILNTYNIKKGLSQGGEFRMYLKDNKLINQDRKFLFKEFYEEAYESLLFLKLKKNSKKLEFIDFEGETHGNNFLNISDNRFKSIACELKINKITEGKCDKKNIYAFGIFSGYKELEKERPGNKYNIRAIKYDKNYLGLKFNNFNMENHQDDFYFAYSIMKK